MLHGAMAKAMARHLVPRIGHCTHQARKALGHLPQEEERRPRAALRKQLEQACVFGSTRSPGGSRSGISPSWYQSSTSTLSAWRRFK
jgi:hypothetical protein